MNGNEDVVVESKIDRAGSTRWAAAFVAAASLAGCFTSGSLDYYSCDDPCGNGQPGHTCDDPCAPCVGECADLSPLDFGGPALLWMGAKLDAPDCPPRAPALVFEGHAGLDDSNQCPACRCGDPSCVLPSGITASDTPFCQGPGFTPIDVPDGWDGSCLSAGAAPLSANSFTIPPTTVSPCMPLADHVPTDLGFDWPWTTFARACLGEAVPGVCGDPGKTCVPTSEPPPIGFSQCILYLRDGEPAACPDSYPDKRVFYRGLDDTRACTPCACDAPEGSDCSAVVTVYTGATCASMLVSASPSLASEICHSRADMQLGSIEAALVRDEPGACAPSGGVAVGKATPLDASAFCCKPPRGSAAP